jgi:phosphoribosylformimino-5-aminoimidazole carboxamide ribotide isomerase
MQLIPVIDLKDGIVVHARFGQRQNYLPICSPLCASSELKSVIKAFLNFYPFKIIYIADLNAITKNGNHDDLLKPLLVDYPEISFWIDSGYQARPEKFLNHTNYQAVLGSECYDDNQIITFDLFKSAFILSLDFAGQEFLGSTQVLTQANLWPEKIIIMTLARVGSQLGIDIEKLQYYQSLVPRKTLIAAGGIRDKNDLLCLKKIGVNYALCASALHSGTISATDLKRLSE